MHYTKDLDEVIKGLKKASKLHAAQAKKLEKIKVNLLVQHQTLKK